MSVSKMNLMGTKEAGNFVAKWLVSIVQTVVCFFVHEARGSRSNICGAALTALWPVMRP